MAQSTGALEWGFIMGGPWGVAIVAAGVAGVASCIP